MKQTIKIENKKVGYTLKVSKKAKYMRLVVQSGGDFFVMVPYGITLATVKKFLIKKGEWIVRSIEHALRFAQPQSKRDATKNYREHREQAHILAHTRVEHFNQFYTHTVGRISIRNQKTRWGSCSLKGNLSFNYRIALLPPHLADYIVVHELCHLVEFNHSPKFWALVARAFPEYKAHRKELQKYGMNI